MESEPRRSLASQAVRGAGAHDERPLCLACRAPIASSEPAIKIRDARVTRFTNTTQRGRACCPHAGQRGRNEYVERDRAYWSRDAEGGGHRCLRS
jgi:hypothetical protein